MTTTNKTLNFINPFYNNYYQIENFSLLNQHSFTIKSCYPQVIKTPNSNTIILLNQFITPNLCFAEGKDNLKDFIIVSNHSFIEDKLFSLHKGLLLPSSLTKTSFSQDTRKTTVTEECNNVIYSSASISSNFKNSSINLKSDIILENSNHFSITQTIHYLTEHFTTLLHNISEKIESILEFLNTLGNLKNNQESFLNINNFKRPCKTKSNQKLCSLNKTSIEIDNSLTEPKNVLETLDVLNNNKTKTTNSSDTSLLSINDILEIFKANNELSTNSLRNYKLAINKFAPNLSDKPFTIQLYNKILENINECKNLVNKNKIKSTTFNLYIKLIKKIIESAFSKNKLKYNSLDELNNFIYQKADNTPRKALDCENFINITEAKTKYQRFLKKLYKTNSLAHFKLWLIHAILCTRKNETIQVIKNFQKGAKTVDIKTKCQSKFTIPITPIVAKLINDIKDWITSKTDRTASEYIYQSIPRGYKRLISPHGTRALFRTIIELLNVKESFEVKEAYLNHNVLNKVQGAYMRNNYLERREKIERKWENWLLNLLGKDIITTLNFSASTFTWKQKIKL